MNGYDLMFSKMVGEAMEEVGREGWNDASQNAVTLASCGIMKQMFNERISNIVAPLRWGVGVIASGVVWYIASGILNL